MKNLKEERKISILDSKSFLKSSRNHLSQKKKKRQMIMLHESKEYIQIYI